MALLAVEMIVLRVAVIVLEDGAFAEIDAAQETRVHELVERAIHGRPADAEALHLHLVDQLIGVEVIVLAEDVSHHVALLRGEPLRTRPARQVLAEFFFRRLRYFDRRQRIHGRISRRNRGGWLVLYPICSRILQGGMMLRGCDLFVTAASRCRQGRSETRIRGGWTPPRRKRSHPLGVVNCDAERL